MHSANTAFFQFLLGTLGTLNSPDEFCKTLVHYLHESTGSTSAFITRLDKDANIRWLGRYGQNIDEFNISVLSVWDSSASGRAIVENKPFVVESATQYEELFGSRTLEHPSGDGLLVLPVKLKGQPAGAIGIGFDRQIDTSILSNPEFEFLALATALLLARARDTKPGSSLEDQDLEETAITQREISILQLIEEGLTHYEIGRVLNLSESTIKQTSSELYKKLGVNKKLDALEKAKALRLI